MRRLHDLDLRERAGWAEVPGALLDVTELGSGRGPGSSSRSPTCVALAGYRHRSGDDGGPDCSRTRRLGSGCAIVATWEVMVRVAVLPVQVSLRSPMTRRRSLIAGMTDYTGVPLNDIVAHLQG